MVIVHGEAEYYITIEAKQRVLASVTQITIHT